MTIKAIKLNEFIIVRQTIGLLNNKVATARFVITDFLLSSKGYGYMQINV